MSSPVTCHLYVTALRGSLPTSAAVSHTTFGRRGRANGVGKKSCIGTFEVSVPGTHRHSTDKCAGCSPRIELLFGTPPFPAPPTQGDFSIPSFTLEDSVALQSSHQWQPPDQHTTQPPHRWQKEPPQPVRCLLQAIWHF